LTYNFLDIQKKLESTMDSYRFQHTLGVMITCANLAMAHGIEDYEKAQIAGLLHDCAKHIPPAKQLELCLAYHLPITETEKQAPYLLHAKLGAYLAKVEYGISDEEILHSIRYHTTGTKAMSDMDKILYIADYIEPSRTKAMRLPYIRKLAFYSLDLCMYEILKDSIFYLNQHAKIIDSETQKAFDYYEQLINTVN